MEGYCDVFLRIILKRGSTEAHVYMRRHQGVKVEHFDVSNVIHHKFSHGGVSYTLSGKNVNVMLEYEIAPASALTVTSMLLRCGLKTVSTSFFSVGSYITLLAMFLCQGLH